MKQVKNLLLLGLVCSFLGSSAVLAQDGSNSAEISQVEQMVLLAESASSESRVEAAKQAVQAATALTNKTKTNLQAAQDAVNEITNKSVGHDKSAILPFTLQPQEMNTIHLGLSKRVNYEEPASEQELVNLEKEEQHADQLIKRAQNLFGKERINLESQTIKIYTESEKEEWLDIRNLSMEDAIEINEVAVKFLNHLRRQYATHTGRQFTPTKLNTKVIEQALQVAKDYMDKGDDNPDKHNGHDRTILDKYGFQTENIWNSEVQFSTNVDGLDGSNLTNFNRRQTRYHYTMAELKSKVIREIIDSTTNDAHAAWGHARHNVGPYDYTAVSFTVTPKMAMHMHTLSKFAGGETYQPYDITAALLTNEEYIAHLESILPNGENLSQAQAQLAAKQAEDSKAKELLHRAQVQLEKVQPSKPQVQARVIYRLYHAASEQYFYTKSLDEATILQGRGWKFEGRGFQTATSGQPVYRLYHAGRKAYVYTSNVSERNQIVHKGWKFEGVAWYSAGTTKVYRLFSPKAKVHMYTANWKEVEILKGRGWKYEGVAFYTLP